MRKFLVLVFLFQSGYILSQLEKVKFELEKTTLKVNFNGGVYKSRIYFPAGTDKANSFSQPAFFIQVYFPFKGSW